METEVYPAASEIHGTGVFAGRRFRKGEVVLSIDDTRVVDDEHPLDSALGEFEYHCDYLADGRVVLMRSPERHINSSCDPNVFVKTGADGIRRVIALREIARGEEITYDYIINCHGGLVWECACGAVCCRGRIPSSFFELPEDLQSEYLPLLDQWFIDEHADRIERLRKKLPGR